ncbi:homing endonuclease associated repeat-containing protein [Thiocystis violacea]|uniref:homing endonuclease associated repeat-containing protein n=1 Tax=Thiocystis violacea TaxID=13725 RepID=UPI0019061AFF|nr:HNH endonuclease [Thiocystis violacea]MBK1723109.1 hypothetical protein [Thiocystis violacea]
MTERVKFKISRVSGAPAQDDELLSDLKRVAEQIGSSTVQQRTYGEFGSFDYRTLERRFGSWNKALELAGLEVSNRLNISEEELFENILRLWEHYGRQPRRSELSKEPSRISQSPYNRTFGSWSGALSAFVEYANSTETEAPDNTNTNSDKYKVKNTGRDPSLRLRWKVLQRDSFKCCACGASPAVTPGVELHVDHVIPWSKGGETVIDNLQTLCSVCNLGKSNEI